MLRNIGIGTAVAFLLAALSSMPAWAQGTPGVTPHGIKIGNTNAYSGPASAYASLAEGNAAFFKMVNDHGGVNGRKIEFISRDDGYDPSRTVEQVHRLVEQDHVAFLFNTLGTPTNSAVRQYLNEQKIPQLFVASGADKWGNYKEFPWTMGWQPSYRIEAQIYAKYVLREKPDSKIAVLFQNDDFGKDYLAGLRDVLGDKFDAKVVTAPYEVTDRHDRQAGRDAAILRRRCPDYRGHAEIRRPGHPQAGRHGVEAAAFHEQRLDLGGRGDRAGRTGAGDRHNDGDILQGPDRSGVGQGPWNAGLQGLLQEILSRAVT